MKRHSNSAASALSSVDEVDVEYIKVWDLPVRIFHWLLVMTFSVSFFTNWLGVSYFKYHLWSGYSTLVLVVFRIVWGLVGSYHAQFRSFIRSPISTFQYALNFIKGQAKPYPGHNPLGAVMVVMLLLALLVQAATGLFANDEITNLGPLYGYVDNDLSLTLTGWHKTLFYWILGAVALHIVAVLHHVFIKKENLIKAMVTGHKPKIQFEDGIEIKSSRIGLAITIVILIVLLLAWVIAGAPEAVSEY